MSTLTDKRIDALDIQSLRRIAYYAASMAERWARMEYHMSDIDPDSYAILRLINGGPVENNRPTPPAKRGTRR
jgi:hypothetical protein